MNRNIRRALLMVPIALGIVVAPIAFAREEMADDASDPPVMDQADESAPTTDVEGIEQVEVSRDPDELPSEIARQPDDAVHADTALVFTNTSPHRAQVACVGFNKNGRPIGRTITRLPPRGLRYVLASDMSRGTDFIGHVRCKPRGRVVGSTVFIGRGITDLPARNVRSGRGRIRFPLVAHF